MKLGRETGPFPECSLCARQRGCDGYLRGDRDLGGRMDRLWRLMVLFVLSSAFGSASAQFQSTNEYVYWTGFDQAGSRWFSAAAAACQASISGYNGIAYQGVSPFPGNPDWMDCNATRSDDGSVITRGQVYKATIICPPDQELDLDEKKCVPTNNCPPPGTVEGDGSNAYESNGSGGGGIVCIGNCTWRGGGVVPRVCANGKCYTFGPFTSVGAKCNGDDQQSPPTDSKCVAKGQCPGTVNGVTVCVPCSNTSSEGGTTTTTTDPSGNQTQETKTRKTTCEGSTCTTTTTTTTTGGGGGGSSGGGGTGGTSPQTTTETTTEPKDSYCAKNPKVTECKLDDEDKSSWNGTCGTAFVCDGDAVQCAQARAGWEAACALQTDQSNSIVLKANTALGQEGLGENDPREASSVFSLSSYIGNRSYGPDGGACISDYSFEYGGKSINVPFSKYCSVLSGLGYAGNAITMIIAMGIVFGGNRRGVE